MEKRKKPLTHTKGLALSFYADDKVTFEHVVSSAKPLACVGNSNYRKNLRKTS